MSYGYDWRPYVPVAQRRRNAEREMTKQRKKGHPVSPVVIEGRTIAHTFWGKAWCENLERYSDYSNRMPRGRTYVRNGSVVDLQLSPGKVDARVAGSSLYEVTVNVAPLAPAKWKAIRRDCTGGIDSLVELLQGRFSKAVMERVCEQGKGLFPSPKEIEFDCSCPDWASMCKHVAAVLYGVGARLDERPELLFRLRQVDEADLIAHAGKGVPLSTAQAPSDRVLGGAQLGDLFGLEMAQAAEAEGPPSVNPASTKAKRGAAKARSPRAKASPPRAPAAPEKRELDDELRSTIAREVSASLAPLKPFLEKLQASVAPPEAAKAPRGKRANGRESGREKQRWVAGQIVQYRQGRGIFTAKIVSLDEVSGIALLERVQDHKRVERPTAKLLAS